MSETIWPDERLYRLVRDAVVLVLGAFARWAVRGLAVASNLLMLHANRGRLSSAKAGASRANMSNL